MLDVKLRVDPEVNSDCADSLFPKDFISKTDSNLSPKKAVDTVGGTTGSNELQWASHNGDIRKDALLLTKKKAKWVNSYKLQ